MRRFRRTTLFFQRYEREIIECLLALLWIFLLFCWLL